MSNLAFIGRLALMVGLVASTGAQAAYSASTTVDTAASTAINLGINSFSSSDPPPLTQTSSLSTPLVTTQQANADQVNVIGLLNLAGSGSATATVSPGSIQLSTSAGGATNISPGLGNLYVYVQARANVTATGSFADAVVWTVAGLAAGTPIYVDYRVSFAGVPNATAIGPGSDPSGSLIGQGLGNLSYQWVTVVGPGGLSMSGGRSLSVTSDGAVSQNMQFGTFTATGYVTLGQPERLQMWASVDGGGMGYAQCLYCASSIIGQGGSSFQPGLTWGGIAAARLFDGTPIDLALLSSTSDSGMNYATAVPEPSSGLLLTLGLTAWLISRRRAFMSPRSGASSTEMR